MTDIQERTTINMCKRWQANTQKVLAYLSTIYLFNLTSN